MSSEVVKLDLARRRRLGMVEAVWGEHKSAEQIIAILCSFAEADELALVTRVQPDKAVRIMSSVPLAKYHSLSCCLTLGPIPNLTGVAATVVVLSGGTSDQTVAEEAALALRCHDVPTTCVLDVGVAGLHRLLEQIPHLQTAAVLIACAGMEGSLPTVLAGLVSQPVIGVPISVGYGISSGGYTALSSMLASCAPGLTVVNIDNGYGAGMAALRILRCQSNR